MIALTENCDSDVLDDEVKIDFIYSCPKTIHFCYDLKINDL